MQKWICSISFFFSMFLLFPSLSFAQVPFSDEIIITQTLTDGAGSVYAADLDGDGDLDVLSASALDDKIAWYENIDGQGSFGAQQVITTSADLAFSVHAADLDGDGDLDVLSASASLVDSEIAWYENTDGQGGFGAQQVITTSADRPNRARSVYAADLDGDGDLDVLSASEVDDKIAWYENTDGQGSFGAQQVITTLANAAFSVYAADLDGDGDLDVLSASFGDDKIAWYENTDGQGSFGAQQVITTLADLTVSVYAADLDGDGDLDVLSASFGDDKIAWYENTDGQGSFGAQQVITTLANAAVSVYAADLDGDGDLDVLSASFLDDKIAWYRNLHPTGVHTTLPNLKEFDLSPNYPNPFNPETIIKYQLPEAAALKLEVYNIMGQKVATLLDKIQPSGYYSVKWHGKDDSGRHVTSGVYIYRLQTGHFVESKKMLLLR